MPEAVSVTFRSVVVALDASVHGFAILDSAATLAERLRVDLYALLVEDESLLRLADLPFAREVNRASAIERVLDATQLQRTLRARSSQLRQAIDQVAASGRINAHMRVVRGHYLAEALSACSSMDLLFLGNVGRRLGVRALRELGRDSRVRSPFAATLAENAGQSGCGVLYTGTDAAVRALEMAVRLPEAASSPLTVFVALDRSGHAAHLGAQAQRALADAPRSFRLISVQAAGAINIGRYLRRSRCRLLIVPRNGDEALAPQVSGLLDGLDCPLVLVG